MSLANKITLGRAFLIPPIVVLFFLGERLAAFLLFGFACAGDVLDGMVARSRGEITTWGKALDPAVDKALYLSLVFSLYVQGTLSLLALLLFLAPQIGLAVGAVVLRVREQIVQGSRVPGKFASLLSFTAIAFLLIDWPGGTELFYAAIAATYIASIDYVRAARAPHGISS